MADTAPLETVRLASARVSVRPAEEQDLDDLLGINGDPEVTRFLPYATWQSRDDGLAWFKRMQALEETGTCRQLVVVARESGRVIGTVLIFRFDAGSARAELGFVLGRAHWGQGFMREALEAVCAHAFSAMGLRRLEAEVNPANEPSNALLRRIGFRLEGTLRKRWVAKGVAYDTNFYGFLAEEWHA
jgi:RimJ/RimL family protein N-acetyltransferase